MNYEIKYELNRDMWNWRDALANDFMGVSWIDNINNPSDKKVAEKILSLDETKKDELLKNHLLKYKNDPNSELNKFIAVAEKDFADKFTAACDLLAKITNKPFLPGKFKFLATTFPRMPYFYDDREIFFYTETGGFWGSPIDGFLHEALHFQFIYHWRNDTGSPVSKLADEEFEYIKEALTVVIDEDLFPLATLVDGGYDSQKDFRALLKNHWKKFHDFGALVDYGLENMSKFL